MSTQNPWYRSGLLSARAKLEKIKYLHYSLAEQSNGTAKAVTFSSSPWNKGFSFSQIVSSPFCCCCSCTIHFLHTDVWISSSYQIQYVLILGLWVMTVSCVIQTWQETWQWWLHLNGICILISCSWSFLSKLTSCHLFPQSLSCSIYLSVRHFTQGSQSIHSININVALSLNLLSYLYC